jgi:hypothetical protein
MIEPTSPYSYGLSIPAVAYNLRSNPELITEQNKKSDEKDILKNQENAQKSLDKSKSKEVKSNNYDDLSVSEKKIVDKLKQIEQEVRAHEQAHITSGGGLVRGGASYTYQSGPDGKKYVVGGEVQIDTSVNTDDLQGAINRMRQVRQAALAPVDPSAQDKAVANEASKKEAEARSQLTQNLLKKFSNKSQRNSSYVNSYA